jgi:osmotically inducible protein OsmC
MVARSGEAEWRGSLSVGSGIVKLGSGAFEGPYSFKSRFEDGKGTNPEELIAAAHAGCFSMALALMLGQSGFTPSRIHTTAKVHIEKAGQGFKITQIELEIEAEIPKNRRAQVSGTSRHCETRMSGVPSLGWDKDHALCAPRTLAA